MRINRISKDRSFSERIDRISEDRSFSERIDRLSERIDRIREDRSITEKNVPLGPSYTHAISPKFVKDDN